MKPGPENASSLRQNPAPDGTATVPCDSGRLVETRACRHPALLAGDSVDGSLMRLNQKRRLKPVKTCTSSAFRERPKFAPASSWVFAFSFQVTPTSNVATCAPSPVMDA